MSKLSSARKQNCATRSWALFISFTTCSGFYCPGKRGYAAADWQEKAAEINSRALEMLKAVGLEHRAITAHLNFLVANASEWRLPVPGQ